MEQAENGELDIYEVAAIAPSWWTHLRGFVALLIQVFVAPLAYIVMNAISDKEFCAGGGKIPTKIVGSILCLYLFLFTIAYFKRLADPKNILVRKYIHGETAKFTNMWYILGFHTNCFCLLMSSVTAVALIYISPDPVTAVMNAVALIFVFEMDDWLVTKSDYVDVIKKLERVTPENSGLKKTSCIYVWPPIIIIGSFDIIAFIFILVSPVYIGYCY